MERYEVLQGRYYLGHAIAGLAYCAVASRYQLLTKTSIGKHMFALALCAYRGVDYFSKRDDVQLGCRTMSHVIILAATYFSRETLKTRFLCAAVLSAQFEIMPNIFYETKTVKHGAN